MSEHPKFTKEGLDKLAAFEIDVDAVQEFRMSDFNAGAESMRARAKKVADDVAESGSYSRESERAAARAAALRIACLIDALPLEDLT